MDNLEKIQTFFKDDLEVKKILYNLLPQIQYQNNEELTMEYSDKLYRALQDIKYYILQMANLYFPNEKKFCNDLFDVYEKELFKVGYDYNKLQKFYTVCFSNMREELVNEVGNNCVGYSINGGVPFSKATSINELLHIMHQSVVNNNNILESMNKLGTKKNINGEDITLLGINNNVSNSIFVNFPQELDCGITDILSLNDRIIMMIRDRGHALSIEIQKENDKYYVKYFIPKICNVKMVNELKGVKKVDNNSKYTVGEFETNLESLNNELFNFISKVPTDIDMFKEQSYNEGKVR